MFDNTCELIERCIRREERAWAEFIDRFSGLVYYSARDRLRRSSFRFNDQDLQDITQGIFVEIWEKARLIEVRKRHKIKAWISIMSQTRALNYMRKKKERLLTENELFKIESIVSGSGEESRIGLEEELETAIKLFKPREKIILKLNIMYGKTHREIAEFMKVPVNTVSTIISRKKDCLRKFLRERGAL